MPMQDVEDFYILGLPIETDVGSAHFLKVVDYPDYILDLTNVGMSKQEIIYKYSQINKDGSLDGLLDELKSLSLYDISSGLPELKDSYYNVMLKVFGDESYLNNINEDNFDYIRNLVLKMNCVQEEEINPNPEIQRTIERSKRIKAKQQDKLTFADICSSIVAYSSINYSDLYNWTIYQLYMTFQRIGQFKNYDTTTLFATVPTEKKMDIESWSKHIDLDEKDKHRMSRKEFNDTTKGLS